MPAYEASRQLLALDLSPQARRLSLRAAAVATAAAVPYFAAIGLYAAAGFTGLPPVGTRILASVSDIVFAPALMALVAGLGSQPLPEVKLPARLSLVILLIISGLIFGLRILDLMIVAGWSAAGSSLDLYALNTPASAAAMFAWGAGIGSAALLASRLFPKRGLAGWARHLFVLWGTLAIAGELLTLLSSVPGGSSPLVLVLAALVRVTSYVIPPAATGVTAWLLRDDVHAAAGA